MSAGNAPSGMSSGHVWLQVEKPLKGARDSLAAPGGRREGSTVGEDSKEHIGLP